MSWTLSVVSTVELMRIKLDRNNEHCVSHLGVGKIYHFISLACLFLSSLLLHTVSVPNMKKGRQRKLEPITFWDRLLAEGPRDF